MADRTKIDDILGSVLSDFIPDKDYDEMARNLFVLSSILHTMQTQVWILVNQMAPKAPFNERVAVAKELLRKYFNQWHKETCKNIGAGLHFQALVSDEQTLKMQKMMGRDATQATKKYRKASKDFLRVLTPKFFEHFEENCAMLESMAIQSRSAFEDDTEGEEWKAH